MRTVSQNILREDRYGCWWWVVRVRSKIDAIQQHWSGLPSWDDMDLPNGNTNTHRKEKIRKSKRDVKGQLRLPTSSSVVCAWICWCLFHVTDTPETCCQYALPSATTFLSESNTWHVTQITQINIIHFRVRSSTAKSSKKKCFLEVKKCFCQKKSALESAFFNA